jgi:hypothetical protein
VSIQHIITASTREELVSWAKQFLQEEGFAVLEIHDWETPSAFCNRLGISAKTFTAKLRDPRCPAVDLLRGQQGKGRLRMIASNPAFEKFCTLRK